jgi:hypothetical protein
MWSSGYGSCLPYSWVLVRSAPVGVLSKICKSPSVVEILFSALHCGEREFLRATALLKGYDGLGSKFLNGGQNFSINAEKITDHYCYRRLRQLICEIKCKTPRQSRLHRTDLQLRSSYAVTLIRAKYASP